jgi:hypothetical protein
MSIKMLNAAGVGLALIGAAALPLQAAAHDQAAATEVVSNDSVVVVRDAETGKLRAPNAAEHAEMQQLKAARAANFRSAPKPTLQRFHPNGARGARLTDEFMSSSVAVLRPDGTLDKQCFDSEEAAQAALQTASVTTSPLKRETE